MARKPVPPSIAPAEWSEYDALAIKALATGTANDAQQKRAIGWIVNSAAKAYDVSFSPVSDRETSFAEGRRFVGLQIVKLVNMPAELLKARKG